MADMAALFLRFVDKTRSPDGCWEWTGYRRPDGYGLFHGRPAIYAHRFAYELHVGPIPTGLAIDHLCRNRGCVNPLHLEPVTAQENARRALRDVHACPQGHAYDDTNTYRDRRGRRACRECGRARHRAYQRRILVERGPLPPKLMCLAGHPFDAANTYVARSGKRQCRACHRERQARLRHASAG